MNVRVITASAGTGKTHRLTVELEEAIAEGRARPSRVVATTFTTEAAAELVERARARLLQRGHARAAQQLLAARIGTVNSVFGSLVMEFAFELGLSPRLHVLDDAASELELRRALSSVVSDHDVRELDGLRAKFESERDWRHDVGQIIEAARANGVDARNLSDFAVRSCDELAVALGAATADDLDGELSNALSHAIAGIEASDDTTQATATFLERIRMCRQDLQRGRALSWGTWAWLTANDSGKKSRDNVRTVRDVAARHVEHPQLRRDSFRFITMLFQIAGATLSAYQEHKRVRSIIDFADQETLALELLRRPDIRAALEDQIDLVLVDEFQDTSPIQLALFLELAQLAKESIWVGDPKQAVYAFRGTDPTLMDAAIESLSSTRHDPDLVDSAAAALGRRVDTLGVSYRSRPALVALTNETFTGAFSAQGISQDRTRLVPSIATDPADLGPIVEYWPFSLERSNADGRAAAVASGIREMLSRTPSIRDRHTGAARGARPGDIAILCRTNNQCQAVASALAEQNVAAVVPRMGLLAAPETRVVCAGLALWLDPTNALSAAELARIVSYPTDLDGLVARVLEVPGRDSFRAEPAVASVLAARSREPDLSPVAVVEAVIRATQLRRLCASWGDAAQRLANLDAIRAHATIYATESTKSGSAATLTGLLRHLDLLAPRAERWDRSPADRQALLEGGDAVTISTWHRAKGREWPITILFGLETMREPTSYGVHVMSDRTTFDISDPLGGRWVRFWPNPYTTSNQKGPVRTAIEATSTHSVLRDRARREALRLLYVGWTRARDRLVFASQPGQLRDGILGTLDESVLSEPAMPTQPSVTTVSWALPLQLAIVPASPRSRIDKPDDPGEVTIGRGYRTYAPARGTASTMPSVPCRIGEVVQIGPRIELRGRPDITSIGDAIHAFLGSDDPQSTERMERASRVLAGYRADSHISAVDVVALATRLWSWIEQRFVGGQLRREWPVTFRTPDGTTVMGTADLVIETSDGLIVIDHKAFPGTSEASSARAIGYSGQLAAYAEGLRLATNVPVLSTWLHFPIRGEMVEVHVENARRHRCDPT